MQRLRCYESGFVVRVDPGAATLLKCHLLQRSLALRLLLRASTHFTASLSI